MKKALLIPFIALIVSCNCTKDAAAQTEQKQNPLYEVLTASQYQGKDAPSVEIVKDSRALQHLYAAVNDKKIPEVDFTRQQIVAIFIGIKNSGGYGIKVGDVVEKDNKIHLSYETTKPAKNANVTMAMTNPFTIIRINSTKPIVIE